MDPNTFLASLQQNGTQFTPAQLQQIQLFQQQQNQQQQQQQPPPPPQNVDTLNTNGEQNGNNVISNNSNNNVTSNNPIIDVNATASFNQGVLQPTGTHQVTNNAQQQQPPAPINPNNPNSFATNNAFQMALLGTTPLQQQLAALSGYSQQQPSNTTGQIPNDGSVMQTQQAGTDNGQAQQQQQQQQQIQQQQIQAWNPQMLQQQFNGINPFMAAQGLVVPTAMNVQQLQQQFLTQQFLSQQLAAAGQNPAMATGNFNHLLASLLTQSGAAASAMNPGTVPGMPNPMFQAPSNISGFPFVPAPVMAPPHQQQLMTTAGMNNPTNHTSVKGNDGMKLGGEVEWTKPFAAKVKKESPFPLKLYQILGNPECQECITWNPHGRSWRILKPPVFEQVVIPLYFRHAKYASFMRQVNGWGFKRVVTGSDHNSYYHELFVRDNPQLCLQMKRIKRNDTDDGKPSKDDDGNDEDFGDIHHDSKPAENNGDGNNCNMTMTATKQTVPTMPVSTPEDLLKFAEMAGIHLPVGLNTGAMVGQPNFMLNNMLPAAALLGNPNTAAMMNGMNPMNFVAGLPGATNVAQPQGVSLQTTQPQFQSMQQQQQQQQMQSQASTPTTVAMSNVTTGTLQQNPNTMNNANNTNSSNLVNTFAGVDSATLAKIQEIVASGGAETLLQQLQQHGQQQQQQQQQMNNGFNPNVNINNSSTADAGANGTNMNNFNSSNENDTTGQGGATSIVKSEEFQGPIENDDEDDEEECDDDEDDEEEDDDDDDDDDNAV